VSDNERWSPHAEARVVEVALGAAASVIGLAARVARPAVALSELAVAAGLHLVRPADRVFAATAARGELVRADLLDRTEGFLQQLVQRGVELVVAVVDLTELARQHLDLDLLVDALDVDAVVTRVNLDAVLARVDLDGIVARVDMQAVLDRIPLDEVVARVDLDAEVSRLDLDAIVKRVDPDAVIARVDVEAALARLDLAAIARQVIDSVDLPEIVRESTGTVASEAVRGVRAEGVNADEAVARFVDRLLRRPRTERPLPP
jgi:hypothetical protein